MDDFEFAKPMHFFVTVEIQGDEIKRRTDVSDKVKTPIFVNNKFYLPCEERRLNVDPMLIFRIFIV